jgi:LytR cell envelope-related transcriptional attenuator
MSNENPGRTGRTNGSAPMGSTVAIVVTLVAVVLGFLILRKVNDNGDSSTVKPESSTTAAPTTLDPNATVAPTVPPETTTPPLVTTGTKVQVANASSVNGAAGTMSTALGGKGFDMAEPANASEKLEVSKVLYNADDPAALAVATSLAVVMGNIEVVAQGVPVPVATGNWAEGSGVVLMLGNDSANKTLAEIGGEPVTGVTVAVTTTTV